jgi:glycosyltransferase A (GT-A) superfamily protein (DUF2064 family)
MAWSLPDDCVLGIAADRPEPGCLNPAWIAEWGPDFAADIHDAILFDTLETWATDSVLAPGGRRVLLYSPADAGPWFDVRVPVAFALQARDPGSAGAQWHSFLAGEVEDGAARVVLISAPVPTLDPTVVVSAFLCLEGRELVLGPATDGGIYLVGARGQIPPVFDGIDFRSPHALGESISRLEDSRLSIALLPPWYKVDTPDSLRMLAGHIRAIRRSGSNPGLPRLEALCDDRRIRAAD